MATSWEMGCQKPVLPQNHTIFPILCLLRLISKLPTNQYTCHSRVTWSHSRDIPAKHGGGTMPLNKLKYSLTLLVLLALKRNENVWLFDSRFQIDWLSFTLTISFYTTTKLTTQPCNHEIPIFLCKNHLSKRWRTITHIQTKQQTLHLRWRAQENTCLCEINQIGLLRT